MQSVKNFRCLTIPTSYKRYKKKIHPNGDASRGNLKNSVDLLAFGGAGGNAVWGR